MWLPTSREAASGCVELGDGSIRSRQASLTPKSLVSDRGTSTCNTTVQQTYGGFQVGHDIAVLNDSTFGANWHFGVTGGYVESNAKDTTPFGGVNSPAGSLAANFQVPFAGLYAAFTKGNFYADGQARVDYYQSEVNDPLANGIFNQRLDARGYSLTGNIGYRFDLPEKWFIEPSLGGVLSHVNVDPFDVSGTQADWDWV